MGEDKLRILVVDDTAIYRQMIRNVCREIPEIEVVGSAKTGHEALEQIDQLDPDLLTLDVQMPGMSGIDVLRELKNRRARTKAIMLSSLTAAGAKVTMDALMEGAFDFILKPSSPDADANRKQLLESLTEKINAFREGSTHRTRRRPASFVKPPDVPAPSTSEPAEGGGTTSRFEAVVIGTSTGGPVALREIIPLLPADLGIPVFVVQHMPPKYTFSLAERLNESSRLRVLEASDGLVVEPGTVYIAPGGQHMKLMNRGNSIVIRTTDDPTEHGCRPSVDNLFRSAAEVYDGRILAVVLTGMGRDGTEGCRVIKRRGGLVFTQHMHGCTVFGMPKSVADEGLSDRVFPLELIAGAISKWIRRNREGS